MSPPRPSSSVLVSRGFRLVGSNPGIAIQWACVILGVVFLVRAIGDMRLVGFTKKVRGTPFAVWDSLFYSPLCLVLSVGCFYVAAV